MMDALIAALERLLQSGVLSPWMILCVVLLYGVYRGARWGADQYIRLGTQTADGMSGMASTIESMEASVTAALSAQTKALRDLHESYQRLDRRVEAIEAAIDRARRRT